MTDVALSVIVPCHNEESGLRPQLEALADQSTSHAYEVIVVDNRSTDATADIASEFASLDPRFRVVSADARGGVAYARNAGAKVARGRSVAFCDGDDLVQPGWVDAMVEALEDSPLVAGGVDPTILNDETLAASRPSGATDRLPTLGSIEFARGNNCGMRRELWASLGGYDEDFVGLEDIEFSLRARADGITPTYAPGAVVAYRFRDGARAVWRQGFFYGRGRPTLIELARELELEGAPGRREGLRSWGWLVLHLGSLLRSRERLGWIWVLANRLGVLRGAISVRSLYV